MSEYWKSNPRKFCDFCKCWIADNKPSIEFHERGKRHNENVQKRLEEIGKKGKEDYENKLKENDYMKEMEEAALKAYKKDIEKNPDLTGTRISEIAQANNAMITIKKNTGNKDGANSMKSESKWFEAKTSEGFSYYWNKDTGDSVWEAPETYVSLEEAKKVQPSGVIDKKSKCKKKKESAPVYGPVAKVDPYGSWQATKEPEQCVDLQLPALAEPDYYVPEFIYKKPELSFDEKVVTLPKEVSKGPVVFKRKKRSEHLKNARRRADD